MILSLIGLGAIVYVGYNEYKRGNLKSVVATLEADVTNLKNSATTKAVEAVVSGAIGTVKSDVANVVSKL